MDICELCEFDFDKIERAEIEPRLTAGVAATIAELDNQAQQTLPALPADRWSSLEYAAHVRDVFLTIRDRLVIGLVEDYADFKPMYRDERVSLGLYATDTAAAVSAELETTAAMLLRLFATIGVEEQSRVVQYGYPGPTDRSLLWMAKQAVHEVEHHLADIQENAGQ